MGYEISFIPTQEAVDKKLKVYKNYGEDLNYKLEDYKMELAMYCMHDHLEFNDTRNAMLQIKCYLNLISDTICSLQKEHAKKEFEESEDHSFFFCGWEFSKDCPEYYKDNTFINTAMKELLILATLVKTDDYFAEDSKLFSKLERIEEIIDEFDEECWTKGAWDIIEDFREFEVKPSDEDDELEDNTNFLQPQAE